MLCTAVVPPVVGLVRRGHDTLVQLLLLMLCPYITNTFVTAGRVHTVPLKLSVFLLLITKWHSAGRGNATAAESDFRIRKGSRLCGLEPTHKASPSHHSHSIPSSFYLSASSFTSQLASWRLYIPDIAAARRRGAGGVHQPAIRVVGRGCCCRERCSCRHCQSWRAGRGQVLSGALLHRACAHASWPPIRGDNHHY